MSMKNNCYCCGEELEINKGAWCEHCGEFICTKCANYLKNLIVCDDCIDEYKECPSCSQLVKEPIACDRCGKEVCIDCLTDDYPVSIDLCKECYEKYKELMDENNFPI